MQRMRTGVHVFLIYMTLPFLGCVQLHADDDALPNDKNATYTACRESTVYKIPLTPQEVRLVDGALRLGEEMKPLEVGVLRVGMSVVFKGETASHVEEDTTEIVKLVKENKIDGAKIVSEGKEKDTWVKVYIPTFMNSFVAGWIPKAALVRLEVVKTMWKPLDEYRDEHAILQVHVRCDRKETPITLRLVRKNSFRNYAREYARMSFVSKDMDEEVVEFAIKAASDAGVQNGDSHDPELQCVAYEADVRKVDAFSSQKGYEVKVSEPAALSFELEKDSPIANTRKDRVELWFRRYRKDILEKSKGRKIPPESVAGAIAWEALVNVHSLSVRAVGVGKVHVTDSQLAGLVSNISTLGMRGSSVAQQVEELKGMPVRYLGERIEALRDPRVSIDYIAAIIGSYADLAEKAYTEKMETIPDDGPRRDNVFLLVALYQGVTYENKPVQLINMEWYCKRKIDQKQKYDLTSRADPTKYADRWVANEIKYVQKLVTQ